MLDGVFVGAGVGDGELLARCRLVPPVDAGSCVESTNVARVRRFWSRLSTVDRGWCLWLARLTQGCVVLTTDPQLGWPKRLSAGQETTDPQALPMPNELIGSREHNWLTSKVLLTAVL